MGCCSSYLSVAMIKYPNKSNLMEKEFVWAHSSKVHCTMVGKSGQKDLQRLTSQAQYCGKAPLWPEAGRCVFAKESCVLGASLFPVSHCGSLPRLPYSNFRD